MILVIVLLISVPFPVFAHSGGTDEYGGHYVDGTNEYHYHHGYPAHDHVDGKCPYDFDDNVDHDRDNSSDDSSSSTSTEHSDYNDSKKPRLTWWQILLAIVLNAVWIVPFFMCVIAPSLNKENILNALTFIALLVAVFSPFVFLFSLLLWWTDGWSRPLCFTIAISGGLTILSVVTVLIISARIDAQKRAAATIPDFMVWYSPTGTCYHSSKSCTVLRNSKNIHWATDRTNTLSIYDKKPCSKCCYTKEGKVYPKEQAEQESALPPMLPVVSSNLKEVGYRQGSLYVHFHNGSVYRYDNVPQSLAERLMTSPSAGKFFNKRIRDHYHFERIPAP